MVELKEGSRFFFSLSLADPSKALNLLERTIGKMDRDELLKFDEGRRDVIWALEGLALYGELFRPSAQLLLSLAEAENETWSNNATGVFSGLFSLGYGELAATSLAPEQRLPILIAALRDNDLRAAIGLKAFDAALALQSIGRWGNDQPFRFKRPVTRWRPATYGEWFEAYRLYWQTLKNSIGSLSLKLQTKGVEILLSRTRELLRVEVLQGDILETLKEILTYPNTDSRDVISTIEDVLNYDKAGLAEHVISQLESLLSELVGASFHSQLRRFVGMDLLHDRLDDEGKAISRTDQVLLKLAEEALVAPGGFISELKWLVPGEAKNGYRFGHAVGHLDLSREVWPNIRQGTLSLGGRFWPFAAVSRSLGDE